MSKISLLLCSLTALLSMETPALIFKILSMAHAVFWDIVAEDEQLISKIFDLIELFPEHLISIRPLILSSNANHFRLGL